ncbi:MAG: hypothetical protein KAR44_09700 [Candidatus Aegiribacteria sp.]|nr:hypothetical protein [Candidatus Aegiribacteria sp.]
MIDETRDVADRREDLLTGVLAGVPGREIRTLKDTGWGYLMLPAAAENPGKTAEGLRVLGICSATGGFLTFETLKLLESRLPGKVNIVGMVTDDPVDSRARITKKRRFWRYYTPEEQEEYERGIIESALTFGVPCYTGEVKCDGFRKLLAEWDPEFIIVTGFGQLIDGPVIDYPAFGIYNVQPADLLNHHGAGPQPWEDLVARRADTTRTAIIQVSKEIDAGSVVGESSTINIRMADGSLTDDVLMVAEKTMVPVDHMVAELLLEVLRRRDEGKIGPVEHIDFESLFTPEFRSRLMEPIEPSKRGHLLPLPSNELRFHF